MINSSTDVRSLAAQFVQVDRANQDQYFNSRKSAYDASLKLYSTLTSKISDFRQTLSDLARSKEFESYSVSQSAEGYANITASGSAAVGSYKIHVSQLAAAHQVALDFASETDPLPTSGTLTLGVGGETFELDMATLGAGADLSALRNAINSHADNTGVKATIVRSEGTVKLLLTSERTGLANSLTMSTDGSPAMADLQQALDQRTELTAAADAKIQLGDTQSLELTSAENTFANVIDGVTIELLKSHQAGESMTFTIGRDAESTKERLQKLVDNYNAVVDAASQTSAKRDGTSRLVLQQLRAELSGSGMSMIGLELNRSGKLQINTTRLNEYQKQNPAGLTELLSGSGGLIERLTTRLDSFTKGENSVLQSSTRSVRSSLDQLQDRMERFDRSMEQLLNRYVAQFSQMQSMISGMEKTQSMFL